MCNEKFSRLSYAAYLVFTLAALIAPRAEGAAYLNLAAFWKIAFSHPLVKTTQADFQAAGTSRTNLDTTTTLGDMALSNLGTPGTGAGLPAGPAATALISLGAFSLQRSDGTIWLVHSGNTTTSSIYTPNGVGACVTANGCMAAGPTFSSNVGSGGHAFKLPDGRFLVVHAGGVPTSNTSIYNQETSGVLPAGPALSATAGVSSTTIKNTDGTFTIFGGGTATTLYSPNGVNGCAVVDGCMAAGPVSPSTLANGFMAIDNTDGTYMIPLGTTGLGTVFYDPGVGVYCAVGTKCFSATGAPTFPAGTGPDRSAHALQMDSTHALIFSAGGATPTANTNVYDRTAKTLVAGPAAPATVSDGSFSIQLPDSRFLISPGLPSATMFFYSPNGVNGCVSATGCFSTTTAVSSVGRGGQAIQLPTTAGGVTNYADAGKFLIVRGSTSTATMIYDGAWFTSGTYVSEQLNPGGITGWGIMSWSLGTDPTVTFQVRTAASSAALSSATYGAISTNGSIPQASGNTGTWLQVKANFSRVIPARSGANGAYTDTFRSEGFHLNKTYAQPRVLDYTATYR